MARSTWHPYAPDQAFGHQAAHDKELLDRALARLEHLQRQTPSAGLPVTTNVALDAAARLRSEVE
jgi:hypothetical protein